MKLFFLALTFLLPTFLFCQTYQTTENLNVRSGPGTEYEVLGKLNKNSSITILEKGSVWSKINFERQQGFISTKFLIQNESSSKRSGIKELLILVIIIIIAISFRRAWKKNEPNFQYRCRKCGDRFPSRNSSWRRCPNGGRHYIVKK